MSRSGWASSNRFREPPPRPLYARASLFVCALVCVCVGEKVAAGWRGREAEGMARTSVSLTVICANYSSTGRAAAVADCSTLTGVLLCGCNGRGGGVGRDGQGARGCTVTPRVAIQESERPSVTRWRCDASSTLTAALLTDRRRGKGETSFLL